jgi:hypothetical protein
LQEENVKAVLEDIMGHGNSAPEGRAMLPGYLEASAAAESERQGGLIFSEAEMNELNAVASELGIELHPTPVK